MLVCPKCNFDNELGRIFCHSCGAKLDLTQIKPPTEGAKMRRRVQRGVSRTIRIGIELIIVGVLVFGIALICLTPEVKPFDATNADLLATDSKHNELDKLVTSRKAGQVVATEAELNTYLTSGRFAKPTGSGLEVVPTALRVTLRNGAILIEFVGSIHFGSAFEKSLYLGYECTPVLRDGQCVFVPDGGWIGKLPIHPQLLAVTPFVDNYFGRLFGDLADERKQLLDPLSKIIVTSDAVTFEKVATH